MIFNSIEFLIFLPVVFICYWFLFTRNTNIQNLFLLISSYIFYGWWDYRFLSLILLSSFIDYIVGGYIYRTSGPNKKRLLFISVFANLSILFMFKYLDFFLESLFLSLSTLGIAEHSYQTLNIIVPIGISFYTFQSMAYSIDCYNGKIKPTNNLISFLTFVSFFPQLVAGPIESAKRLLPQIQSRRWFSYEKGVEGCRLILWGLFKKIVIADTIALSVNEIFLSPSEFNGGVLLLGVIYFSIQIYCDFSGYSDIAIGTAKLFGIQLSINFNYPYFAKSIPEFWRRWHISLTTWFNEYLFYPLSLKFVRLYGKAGNLLAFFIYFLMIGLWHGPNSNFISFSVFHWILFTPIILKIKPLSSYIKFHPPDFLKIIFTYFLVLISLILFRSSSFLEGLNYIWLMISELNLPDSHRFNLIYVFLLFGIDYKFKNSPIDIFPFKLKIIRILSYMLMALMILFYFGYNSTDFIYFQF